MSIASPSASASLAAADAVRGVPAIGATATSTSWACSSVSPASAPAPRWSRYDETGASTAISAASRMRMSVCGSRSVRSSDTALMSSSVESTGFSPFAMIQLPSIACLLSVIFSLRKVPIVGGPEAVNGSLGLAGLTVVGVAGDGVEDRRFAPEQRCLAHLLLDRRGRHRVAEEQQQRHRLDDGQRPDRVEGDLA